MFNIKSLRWIYLILGILWLAFLVKEAMGNGDFSVFLKATQQAALGNSPYNEWLFISEGNYAQYYYSPFWMMLLTPFIDLPSYIPNLIWGIASSLFLLRSFQLLKNYLPKSILSSQLYNGIIVLTLLFTLRFVLYNFQMIQLTLFILWGILESLRCVEKRQFSLAGALLALVINIKLLPLVLLPYLIYRKHYKALLSTLVFSAVYLILPALLFGWSTNLSLLMDWGASIDPFKAENLIEIQKGAHSLGALIPSLFTVTEGHFPNRRHLIDLYPDSAIMILNIVRLGLIMLCVYFLQWPPFRVAKTKLYALWEISFLMLLIPLIFPHQQKYAFVLIFPTVFYLNFYLLTLKKQGKHRSSRHYRSIVAFLLLSFLLMTLTTDGLIGKHLYELSQHYKLITYGALMLIPALGMAKPDVLMDNINPPSNIN